MQNRDIEENPLDTRIGVGSLEEAEAAIARLQEMGADFVKIRTVANKDTYWAISKAASDAGLKLFGHADLPFRHLRGGNQASLEHLPADTLRRSDESERRQLWRELAKRGTAIVPTTVDYTHSIFLPIDVVEGSVEDVDGTGDDRNRYVSDALRLSWREQVVDRKESRHPDYETNFDTWFSHLREAHEEGVKILPGTDDGVVLMYSGFSLHDELAMLVKHLDVAPLEILKNATIESTRLLGLEDELGTVEEGKLADLVLLNRNPLDDITNSRSIEGVFRAGAYFDSEAIR